MKTAQSLEAFKAFRNQLSDRIGFVPTMGALHEGHLSLVRLAKEHTDHVIVSIYVNPTQFAPHEDFDSYPRDMEGDLALLEREGVELAFLPAEADIYPGGPVTSVQAGPTHEGLESDFRPHFFHGVATVVHRLFEIVRPTHAVFGEKDFQQLQVIRDMVAQQQMGIEIIGAPIARDDHGLALSSRNAYLSEEELEIARMLNQVIYKAAHDISEGGDDVARIEQEAAQMLLTAGFDKVDYVTAKSNWSRVLAAGWVGKTRLIDNCHV